MCESCLDASLPVANLWQKILSDPFVAVAFVLRFVDIY